MRGDDGILIRGRFRHGNGGMGLNMERHPWNRRDLPTTTGVAGSNIGLARGAQQASRRPPPLSRAAAPGNLLHDSESEQERRNDREMSMGRWDRIWERACLQVCCATNLEVEDEEVEGGAEMMQIRIVDMPGDGR